jgi:hypothetical protein
MRPWPYRATRAPHPTHSKTSEEEKWCAMTSDAVVGSDIRKNSILDTLRSSPPISCSRTRPITTGSPIATRGLGWLPVLLPSLLQSAKFLPSELYSEQVLPHRHKRRHFSLLEHSGSVCLHCAGEHLCGRMYPSLFYLRELLANNTFWDLRSHEGIKRT